MNKRFLAIAITAGLVSSFAASADAKFYGVAHLTMDKAGTSGSKLIMGSNTSAFGFKGKEDLGGGMTALFKAEFQFYPDVRNRASAATNSTVDRDQWAGLKIAGMGTMKFGTMTSNYKATGKSVDPFYRTNVEGRGLGLQSNLHSGAGIARGRSTNTFQFTSSKIAGMKMVFNRTFSGAAKETTGLGVRYKTKSYAAYFDYLSAAAGAATKVGASYKMGATKLGFQFESAEDLTNNNYTFISANHKLNSNDNVMFSFGTASNADSGFALGYNHKLSKKTNTYVAMGKSSATGSKSGITAGLRHKF